MTRKTSMFGSAMSSYSNPKEKENDEISRKVGRPKGSGKKEPTKSSFTTKLDNNVLAMLKNLSEEKSLPINRIIEDFVKYMMITVGRGTEFYSEQGTKSELERRYRYDMKVIADRYKRIEVD